MENCIALKQTRIPTARRANSFFFLALWNSDTFSFYAFTAIRISFDAKLLAYADTCSLSFAVHRIVFVAEVDVGIVGGAVVSAAGSPIPAAELNVATQIVDWIFRFHLHWWLH